MDAKPLLETIAKSIVNYPDAVRVEDSVDEMGLLFSLHVDPSDMGFIIGRQGATISAVRSIIRVIGLRNKQKINIKVIEPENRS